MFRLAVNIGRGHRSCSSAHSIRSRPLVTSKQKRVLNEQQLGVSNEVVADAPKLETSSPGTPPPHTLAEKSSPAPLGGGGRSAVIPVVAVVGVAAAGTYYFDLIPAEWTGKDRKTDLTTKKIERSNSDFTAATAKAEIPVKTPEPKDKALVEEKSLAKDKLPKKVNISTNGAISTTREIPAKDKIPKKGDISTSSAISTTREIPAKISSTAAFSKGEGNRVTQITFPPIDRANRSSQIVPPVQHAPDGHRVTTDKMFTLRKNLDSSSKDSPSVREKEKETALPVAEEQPKSEAEIVKFIAALPSASMAADAASELKSTSEDTASTTFQAAQRAIKSDSNDFYLNDLDELNQSQLKVRVVQLIDKLMERSRWEALRLKEFLAINEKEVTNKYLDLLQKQRLEFEDLIARSLREQEDRLSRQTKDLLQSKEDSIQSVVSAATEAQRAEHEAELQSASERYMQEYEAKYEAQAGTAVAKAKNEFAKELEAKMKAIEELTAHLRKLEQVLEISRNFESGSQKAHRVSASALALAEKMETSMGAAEEFAALQAASAENGVIASALSRLPSSVKSGVPTVSELQTRFAGVHTASRRAALVPEGRVGLGGQLAGILFAALTVPPSLDAVPPPLLEASSVADVKTADYILSHALRLVQLGDLEPAVEELDKLTGMAAFAVKDWKQDALDRIAVHHALKVIKMECALMNKNMGGSQL